MDLNSTTEPPYDNERPDYVIQGWETSPNGLILNLRMRNTRLDIYIETPNFYSSPKAVAELLSTKSNVDSDRADHEVWDYFYWVASQFLSELRQAAPPVNHVGTLTLADLQRLHYCDSRLEFYNEVPQPGAIMPRERDEYDASDCDIVEPPPAELAFPRFQLSEVEVPYSDPSNVFDIIPENVSVHGQPLFWKPAWMSVVPGVEKYDKIQSSNFPPSQLRTSRLFGIVVNSRGVLCGQLYHWIDIEKHLTWDVLEAALEATRVKWASQINSTVLTLHSLDIVWGDVKAENVVIDKNDDAIVIDLEGGVTTGWVDKDEISTKQGDLQGLEKLVDYIMNENCPLRLRDKERDQRFSESPNDE